MLRIWLFATIIIKYNWLHFLSNWTYNMSFFFTLSTHNVINYTDVNPLFLITSRLLFTNNTSIPYLRSILKQKPNVSPLLKQIICNSHFLYMQIFCWNNLFKRGKTPSKEKCESGNSSKQPCLVLRNSHLQSRSYSHKLFFMKYSKWKGAMTPS